MNSLEAYEIRKSYNSREVLKGISLTVHPGEILAILGQNGAGKTTAIKIFSSLLKYDSGELTLFGEKPFTNGNIDRIRQRIGYVGQDSERSAYGRLSVEENLVFFGRLMGVETKEIKQKVNQLAAAFQFEDKLPEQFMKLSGGQKQTTIIMRALLHDPELLFLDEPTKGLDPLRARQIRLFLKIYIKEQNKSLLLTSHILSDITYLADKVAFMRAGRIEFFDTPENACALLGYSDIVEIKAGSRLAEVKACLQPQSDIHILSDSCGGPLVLGTNDFYKILDSFRDRNDLQRDIEFLHRKVNLEDAYFHFTQADLSQSEGENGNGIY